MARKVSSSKQLQITLEGPFFERNPTKTFRANVRDMMDALASEAEASVRSDIAGRPMPHSTGHTARHVRGRVSSLIGKPWEVTAVVSMDTRGMTRKEAIRTQAAASSVEGRWHPFRRTASAIRRSRAVISANLTRGME